MRLTKIIFVAIAVLVAVGGAWLAFAWHRPPASMPLASISLIGYTNLTMSRANPNAIVYPGPGEWLLAKMRLKNEGNESISYGAWGGEPYGWANAQTGRGKTNGYLAPHFTGGTA